MDKYERLNQVLEAFGLGYLIIDSSTADSLNIPDDIMTTYQELADAVTDDIYNSRESKEKIGGMIGTLWTSKKLLDASEQKMIEDFIKEIQSTHNIDEQFIRLLMKLEENARELGYDPENPMKNFNTPPRRY